MTAILFLMLLAGALWTIGLSGLLRWAGIAGCGAWPGGDVRRRRQSGPPAGDRRRRSLWLVGKGLESVSPAGPRSL